MRHRFASASDGVLRPRRVRVSRELLLLASLAVLAVWIVAAFGQELYLSYQLTRQAADLRRENAALQVANEGYQRDIAAVSSGAAAEEEARLNGYSRADERLYLITVRSAPGGPAPGVPSTAQPSGAGKKQGRDRSLPEQAWAWLTGGGHRV
jgi:cell division protein FtsB